MPNLIRKPWFLIVVFVALVFALFWLQASDGSYAVFVLALVLAHVLLWIAVGHLTDGYKQRTERSWLAARRQKIGDGSWSLAYSRRGVEVNFWDEDDVVPSLLLPLGDYSMLRMPNSHLPATPELIRDYRNELLGPKSTSPTG